MDDESEKFYKTPEAFLADYRLIRMESLRAEQKNMRAKCMITSPEDFLERAKNADRILENCRKRY
jgi:hypothetical protein